MRRRVVGLLQLTLRQQQWLGVWGPAARSQQVAKGTGRSFYTSSKIGTGSVPSDPSMQVRGQKLMPTSRSPHSPLAIHPWQLIYRPVRLCGVSSGWQAWPAMQCTTKPN